MLQSLLPLRFHRFALKLKSARTKGDYVSLFLFHNYIIYDFLYFRNTFPSQGPPSPVREKVFEKLEEKLNFFENSPCILKNFLL